MSSRRSLNEGTAMCVSSIARVITPKTNAYSRDILERSVREVAAEPEGSALAGSLKLFESETRHALVECGASSMKLWKASHRTRAALRRGASLFRRAMSEVG
jgi:hypothetical protein